MALLIDVSAAACYPFGYTLAQRHTRGKTMSAIELRRQIQVTPGRLAPIGAMLIALVLVGCIQSEDPVAAGDCVIPTVSLHFGEDNPHLEEDGMPSGGGVIEFHDGSYDDGSSDGSLPDCRPSVTWVVAD